MCPDKGAAEQVVVSGALTLLTAKLVAELATECEFSAASCWAALFSDPWDQTTPQSPSSLVLSGRP